MTTTLRMLSAGDGVIRVPAFHHKGVDVPMVTVLRVANGWDPFIDGENLRTDCGSTYPSDAVHRMVCDYLRRHGIKYGLHNIEVHPIVAEH